VRVSSPVLWDLARSTAVAELGLEDQRITVPPVVAATVRLQHALGNILFNASDPQRGSFSQEFESFQTGVAVGASTTIALFVEGLWDIWAAFTHVTDLAEAITTDPRAGLQLIDPVGGTTRLLIALAGTQQTQREARWRFLFPRLADPALTWKLTHFVEATVLGQERYAHSALVCNRLF